MTDPTDETQPHQVPGVIPPPPGPASAGGVPAPAPGPLDAGAAGPGGAASTVPEPDEAEAASTVGVPPPTAPLRADPDRPQTAWREPPWVPPAPAPRRGPSPIALVVGGIILLVGLYFFVDRTLGIDLPAISWGSLWPVILIVIGGLIVVRAWDRNS